MKKYFLLSILACFIAGCSSDTTEQTPKPNKAVTKKTEAEELSIKDIENITARVNYSFSKNNLPLDSSSYIDSLKKEISAQIKQKRSNSVQ